MDYAIALDRMRPAALCTHMRDYANIVRTWVDPRPIPTDNELIAAYAEWEVEQIAVSEIEAVHAGAETIAANIPDFATWTEQEGRDWIATNIGDTPIDAITNLAEAKLLMKKQAVAVDALWRVAKAFLNDTWPHLQDNS